ncbi:enoyl-CoA hydratase-related protein [Notoacmeibacter ruber]|uniref:Enoyl-CoA hydratase n=1 Tax=Notoacmeibacter ruber TaxID=2670375 RepID=A0A3L7JAT2_9HYPH|nr:enoyl-CoA hydratase-related protein [Notoacmeibacter ruber]RLQ87736.1 enoyl-CoA hydratase [Notoacmeibacter ruber]
MTGFIRRTQDHVSTLTIERPDKRNALTLAMWEELAAHIRSIEDDGQTRVLILNGAGDHFCAGADIGEFDTTRKDAESARHYESSNVEAFAAIRNAHFPIIAAIRGTCFGGGFGLAAACDIRLADETARFCVPASRLGLAYPHEAMIDIVNAVGPQLARYLAFTADSLSAEEALSHGFLLRIESKRPVLEAAEAMAKAIAQRAPLSAKASKAAILATIDPAQPLASKTEALGAATFDSADYQEGREAFRQKRNPIFHGA